MRARCREEPIGHAAVRRIIANQAALISLAGAPRHLGKRRHGGVCVCGADPGSWKPEEAPASSRL